jgi:serine protease inhibitor
MGKPPAGCLKRLGYTALALVALEFVCPRYLMMPGPLTLGFVGTYNGIQWARANLPTPTRMEQRRKAAGPPPDPRVVGAGNDFGLRLFRRLCGAHPGKNVLLSPSSANAALCLAYNGAEGRTKADMATVLRLQGIPLADVNAAQRRVAELLANTDPRVQVSTANSVWAGGRAALKPAFTKTAENAYGGHAATVDFAAPEAPDHINAWVSNHTGGHITGAVSRLPPNAAVILANATYFRGEWSAKFEKNHTRPGLFHLMDGTTRMVPMMNRGGATQFFSGETFRGSRLPYGDGGLAMYICVPSRKSDLQDFLKGLTRDNWDRWLSHVYTVDGSITMPRMHVETALSLANPLKEAGMARAFHDTGEFTAMGSPNLFLSDVPQKTYLQVDEEGTTAAAMTLPSFAKASRSQLSVDRPFFLAIRDDRSGVILFAGAIYDPQPDRQ